MRFDSTSLAPRPQSLLSKARNTGIGFLFAAILLVPRMLHLRRSESSWMAFRIALGILGAVLVVVPIGLWNSYLLSVFGMLLFISAILMPPAKPVTFVDDKARELGALIVVNGGQYQPGNAPSAAVQLFVGEERIWALDSHLQPLLVIPVSEIIAARAQKLDTVWYLRVRWSDCIAEFSYRGVFAEHLARTAETTLASVIRPELPVIPAKARAARA